MATFLECGYDGTSMEAIARAAGVTKQTLYSRYADKRAVFLDVIPWAFSRTEWRQWGDNLDGDDLTASLTAIGREAMARAVDPAAVGLMRIAMNESARFPEFAVSVDSLMWSPRLRAVIDLLRRHEDAGTIEVDDIEVAAEHFLAMVQALPQRLADFGVFRSKKEEERRIRQAVKLFVRGISRQL